MCESLMPDVYAPIAQSCFGITTVNLHMRQVVLMLWLISECVLIVVCSTKLFTSAMDQEQDIFGIRTEFTIISACASTHVSFMCKVLPARQLIHFN